MLFGCQLHGSGEGTWAAGGWSKSRRLEIFFIGG